jgi:DNA primase catalytic core
MSRIQNFEDVIHALKPKLREYLSDKGINTKMNFACIHPGHSDTVASAGIIARSDFTKWNCFGCHESGDIFDAALYLEGLPNAGPDFVEKTVSALATRYGIEVKIKEPTEEEKYRIESFSAYKLAAQYIANHPTPKAIAEMERRNWNPGQCRDRLIGGVDSFEAYSTHMRAVYSTALLMDIDLLKSDLFSANNLIFTVSDEHGRPCGFGAKNLIFDKEKPELGPKYINTSAKCHIYDKSKRLYNIHIAKREEPPVYIMEGYGDVEMCNQQGLTNAVCVGGTAFTEYHILELLRLGKTEVVLCLDGDKRGLEGIDSMLEKFVNYRQFTIHVVRIPEELDPDDYVRKYGIEQFKKLRKWTAFEWKLDGYDDRIDPVLIRREVVPIIASEWSPIERERMSKVLSDKIGISVNSILEEVRQLLDEKESKKSQEQKIMLEQLIMDLKSNPNDWRLHLNSAHENLENLSQDYNQESFSTSAYLRELDIIKTDEEDTTKTAKTMVMLDYPEITEALKGNWSSTLNVIGGGANTGKTALMSCLARSLATHDENDALVLFHTIDDTLKQFTTRLICQFAAEVMPTVTLNMIKDPNAYPDTPKINKARDYGYHKLKDLVARNKLLVRGGETGGGATLAFARDMIQYYKKLFPDKQIIYFLDNFHRVRDFSNISDERVRFKKLSGAAKDMAKEFEIPIWATMEYNKTGTWDGKPTNNSISESIAMEYDANVIIHIYNDLHIKRDDAETFFTRKDRSGLTYRAPRVELIFGKNKINEFKGSQFMDFYTEQSRFQHVPLSVALEDMQRVKETKRGQKANGAIKFRDS